MLIREPEEILTEVETRSKNDANSVREKYYGLKTVRAVNETYYELNQQW